MRNVVLTDFPSINDWGFTAALGEVTHEEWTVESFVTNRLHGSFVKNVWRMVLYFYFPFRAFIRRKEYKNVIGWQQFYGLNFAFFSRLFRVKKTCNLLIMTFIYNRRVGKRNIIP